MAIRTQPFLLQDAVRGDHGEVAQLLINHGAKIFKAAENRLVDLNRSHLAGCALSAPKPKP